MTTDTSPITQFTGEYGWLSNFHHTPLPVVYDGAAYPTSEHCYQAAKTLDRGRRAAIAALVSAAEAKRAGAALTLRPGWEDMKVEVMSDILQVKFEQVSLRTKLIATGDRELVEGCWWPDVFWGVYMGRSRADIAHGEGQNMLGLLLMAVRESVR